MDGFGPATRAWFERELGRPTEVQRKGWPLIAAGDHALLIAPTGSGKTLAAFLWCIDRLATGMGAERAAAGPGVRVLYVSPLKALVYDIERNLRAPLAGIEAAARDADIATTLPRVAVRTGDTTSKQRRQQAKNPSEILVTTPESLYLVLGSQVGETLRSVDTVIVDEVHALAGRKRGAHLALSLERLAHLTAAEPQRIGLSATARPSSEVARFLGGDRPVAVVDTSAPPRLDLQIVVPAGDMTRPNETAVAPPRSRDDGASDPGGQDALAEEGRGMWPAIYPHLVALIRSHQSTILFVNSRALCERLCHRLNELAGEELVRSHHGSLSHAERRRVEELLKSGQLAGLVATSSLELGIDMGAVDLVLLVESPGAVARGLQRVGRAGHGVGQVSKGRLFPKHRGDLLEATVVAHAMASGDIEALAVPKNPLDVLAQQVVAAVATEPWTVSDLAAVVRRAANYRDLPDSAYIGVLDMLSGRYPSSAFADLEPRIVWDRHKDELTARRGAKMVALVNGGTIPDRGLYGVYYGDVRVGELDEEMVQETQAGELFTLGATTWRVEEITRDRVAVVPAPGEAGKLPFWRGDGPGRPVELGRAVGQFVRQLGAKLAVGEDRSENDELPAAVRSSAESWLSGQYHLDALAARNLVDYVCGELLATGVLPSDRCVVIERFPDELGDFRVCVLSPFGSRVHAPWSLILQARLGALTGYEVKSLWSDDGIVLRFGSAGSAPAATGRDLRIWQLREALLPEPGEIDDVLTGELASSPLFAGQFRENASRALLMPRRRPGQRTPLWVQRLKAQELLAVAREYASFPVVMETYRSCMKDVFDTDALKDILAAIHRGDVRIEVADTSAPSPFARSLVFDYVATFLYQGDAPLAERKAQALTLDRQLLRELLGSDDLRELLDGEVIAEVEAELQALVPDRQVAHPDALHRLLRRTGDLAADEIAARTAGDAAAMLDSLRATGRAVPISAPAFSAAGQKHWIAVEDAALYRDALAATLPDDVPDVFLAGNAAGETGDAIDVLILRFARSRGPFSAGDVAVRFGLTAGEAEAILRRAQTRGEVVRIAGPLSEAKSARDTGGGQRQGACVWCHPDILRRIKQRTLARLRRQVAPVPGAQLASFLPSWHGVLSQSGLASAARRGGGLDRLQEVLIQLEGLPLPYGELEEVILPARVADFSPRMLDELGAMGWLVWVGHGALGSRDGKVALYRREHIAARHEISPSPGELGAVHRAVLAHLEQNGASFFVAIEATARAACSSPAESSAEVLAALWDLVWAGLVTNDTFGPLRARKTVKRGAPRTDHHPRRRSGPSPRRRGALSPAGGRWSLVRELAAGAPSPTELAHRRAVKLLERHGIVTREAAALEMLPGGFAAVYPVLRAMEEAGKVRRGYFVAGVGGAQFALAAAVDQLRASGGDQTARDRALVLSAVDPANPYGWLLPWPDSPSRDNKNSPRRAAGASVVLVGGEAVLYLDRGGRRAVTFAAADDGERLLRATRALDRIAARNRGKMLRIETIDGQPARTSARADAFIAAGFFADPRGLVRELRLYGSG